MSFATAHTVALDGALGHLIDVQADVSPGVAGVTVVGRADAALREGQERVRMAVVNSDLRWPTTKRTTILLSPADLPKSGTHFDLAIAVAVLVWLFREKHPMDRLALASVFGGAIGNIMDKDLEAVSDLAPIAHVTRELATYNLTCIPVVNEQDRVVGAVSVDDLLDHILPDDWRAMDLDDAETRPAT